MTAGVVTGEAVALDVRLAHWPSRLVAFVIDVLVQYLGWLIATLALTRLLAGADSDMQVAVVLATLVIVVVGYPVAMETLWSGRSLGKAALGIRVVRDDGGPERFRHALARGILMPLEFWGPALVSSIISSRAKRLGDMLAGTVVVQTRVPKGRLAPIAMPPPLAMWASTLDLSRLTDDLAMSCRQFLARQHELAPATREAMGSQLVAAVLAAVSPPPPPGTPGWAYLSAVLAERRRREEWRLRAVAQHAPGYGAPAHGQQQYAPQPGYPPQPAYAPQPGYPPQAPAPARPSAPPPPPPPAQEQPPERTTPPFGPFAPPA